MGLKWKKYHGRNRMVHQYTRNLKKRIKTFFEDQDDPDIENIPINLETVIKGTTLDVYFYLLRKKSAAGVREIQRNLNLSSPSISSYHLNKLANFQSSRITSSKRQQRKDIVTNTPKKPSSGEL